MRDGHRGGVQVRREGRAGSAGRSSSAPGVAVAGDGVERRSPRSPRACTPRARARLPGRSISRSTRNPTAAFLRRDRGRCARPARRRRARRRSSSKQNAHGRGHDRGGEPVRGWPGGRRDQQVHAEVAGARPRARPASSTRVGSYVSTRNVGALVDATRATRPAAGRPTTAARYARTSSSDSSAHLPERRRGMREPARARSGRRARSPVERHGSRLLIGRPPTAAGRPAPRTPGTRSAARPGRPRGRVIDARIDELRHAPKPRSGAVRPCVCSSAFCTKTRPRPPSTE